MNKYQKRRLPWVLMCLGAAMALCALAALSRTGNALQYAVVAPAPGEGGEAILKLADSGAKLGASMKDALAWTAVDGYGGAVSLSAGENTAEASLLAIGEGWLEVYPRFLAQGRLPGAGELAGGARVMLLDEGLAFKLFGTELPEDAAVKLNGVSWRAVGTVRHGNSLLGGRGVGDETPFDCYVPLAAAAREGLSLNTLTLSALPQGGSGAARLFQEAAETRWLAGGELIDLGKEAMRRTILPRVVLLIAGLYALVGLFKRMYRLAAGWFEDFRAALRRKYLGALVPRLAGIVALTLLGFGALISLAWLLLVFSAQPLYVFTEWVPENIVSWSSIAKVFWSLTQAAARRVRVGTPQLRVVEFWGGVLRWGIILLLLGAALLPKARKQKGTD